MAACHGASSAGRNGLTKGESGGGRGVNGGKTPMGLTGNPRSVACTLEHLSCRRPEPVKGPDKAAFGLSFLEQSQPWPLPYAQSFTGSGYPQQDFPARVAHVGDRCANGVIPSARGHLDGTKVR